MDSYRFLAILKLIYSVAILLTFTSLFSILFLQVQLPSLTSDLFAQTYANVVNESFYYPPKPNLSEFILKARLLLEPGPFVGSPAEHPQIIIVVHSAPKNFQRRAAIRETWGSWARDSFHQLYFLIGNSPDNQTLAQLEQEGSREQDIIQYDFLDHYLNLTLKSLFMLRYYNERILDLNSSQIVAEPFYNQTNYRIGGDSKSQRLSHLLKADDDMFIHIPHLHLLIKKISEFYQREFDSVGRYKLLMGAIIRKGRPQRRSHRKYFVPEQFYAGEM